VFLLSFAVTIAISARKTAMSGQVFIVTQGRDNIKLGAVEVVLIEKQQVIDFLRKRQSAIDAQIKTRQQELANARQGIETAKAKAQSATSALDSAIAAVPTSTEYLQIQGQKDALASQDVNLEQQEERLRSRLLSLGVSGNVERAQNEPALIVDRGGFFPTYVKGQAVAIFDQFTAVQKALSDHHESEQEFESQLRTIQNRVDYEERPKVTAAENAITEAESHAVQLQVALGRFPTADDYFSGLFAAVSVAQTTLTDADGKFSMACPRGKAFTLFATAERVVFGSTETYYWLIDAPTGTASTQILLNNNNLAEVDPDGYFKLRLKRMDSATEHQ
jgi:hypothetical protein